MNQKKIIFLALFVVIGFITLQIPVNKLAGSNVSFTLFDFFGPIAGAFIGTWLGMLAVFLVEVFNLVVLHAPLTIGTIIRLFPTLFAVYYFAESSKRGNKNIYILAVPILAMLIFWANPVGRSVWYYALFWLIPVLAYFKREILLVRSLGTTFIAHAVGGAAWIWVFHLPASVWKGLIPVVIEERILFTLGIAASYLLMKQALKFLISQKLLPPLESIQPAA